MSLSDGDRELVTAELGRDPTAAEAELFENLWSEHCAYRSSRPLLSAFDSDAEQVVIGPGDDAAVVTLDGDTHNPRNYKQDLMPRGQILWEIGRETDFDDVRDELAEAHRRWVEAGLSEGGDSA